jgi:predicted amidophosphoribosyltransferase
MQARKKAANFIYLKPVYSQNQKQLPHSVLLLDDVRTSGTTLAQAEQVLFENGVKKIEKTIFATVRQKL